MRNNMSYEEAVEKLKELESVQRVMKYLSHSEIESTNKTFTKEVIKTRYKINLLLSIIHAHKAARKLYGENQRLRSSPNNYLNVNNKDELVSDKHMIDFWQSFVEGQSKAIHLYSKQNREYRRLLRENGLLDEKK